MTKRNTPLGTSETDALVMRYLARRGIDHRDVMAYEIRRAAQQSVITLEMWFSDEPAGAEVTGLDKVKPEFLPGLPRASVDSPYIVGERGPEAYIPPHHQV
jgi:hypothetical protein